MTRTSRRRWLRAGLGGAAALGAGGLLAHLSLGYGVPADVAARLTTLSKKEYVIVRAIVARMVRAEGPGFPSVDEVEAALFVDRMVADMDEATRDDLMKLLQVVEHALPLKTGRATRFSRLDGAAQDAVLAAMMTSDTKILRGAFEALKSLAAMAYFRDARTWGPIGYDGPWVGRPGGGWPGAGAPP